jgi:predicted Fe-Mo cluster-binding NifX family protein
MVFTRLAIATSDGNSVCDHLARSSAVMVFNIENGAVVSKAVRTRDNGSCGQHGSFLELLAGCQAVICGGIGQGAANALTAHGIQPVVLAAPLPVESALACYLSGSLATTDARVCLCGPSLEPV